jgi:hypothetical protein
MDVKRRETAEYNLHRVMGAVLELRLQVASLEKIRRLKLLGSHPGSNVSASTKTNANGRRTRKTRFPTATRQMP